MEFRDLLIQKINDAFPGQCAVTEFRGETTFDVPKEQIVKFCSFIKQDADLSFTKLEDVTAIDWAATKKRFTVVYHIFSTETNFRICIRAAVDESDLAIDSVASVWRAADWCERETYDMYGIQFRGHPDLRRMYMPEEYEYHPLRKEFPLMGIPNSIPLPTDPSYRARVKSEDFQPQIVQALLKDDPDITIEDALDNEMILNMGPQHPATHGVLRLLLRLDGETVMKCVPELGYLHRGYEKMAENMGYMDFIPHTDRLDYISPPANNVAYALAVEKLAGVTVPPRAQYIRMVMCELSRVASHLVAIGSLAMDVGALTVFLWTLREREKILDIFDVVCGARFTTSYTRIGGVAQDMTDQSINDIRAFIKQFDEKMDEVERLLNGNRIFIERLEGIGVISAEDAVDLGLTGPGLRASGVRFDLRRNDPYLFYPEIDFNIPVYAEGDSLARYFVRCDEVRESCKIITQVLDRMPKGDIKAHQPKEVLPRKTTIYTHMEELIHDFMLVNFGMNPPVGEIYQAIENSKGELGFYIVSKGEGQPWKMKIRSPSFMNLQSVPHLVKGRMISDVVAIIGSLDPVMGEADK